MDLRFYLDPETGQPHIFKHGVSEDEVREICSAPAKIALATRGAA